MKKLSNEEAVQKFRSIHGDKYDYTKVVYQGQHTKVTVVCRNHGAFMVTPSAHTVRRKTGCPKCPSAGSLSVSDFVSRAQKIHGRTYDYTRVVFEARSYSRCKVIIVCRKHGAFHQSPANHVKDKTGCPKCFGTPKSNKAEFVRRAKAVHGSKYGYAKVVFDGMHKDVTLVCKIHGDFQQRPNNHVHGSNCPVCGFESRQSFVRKTVRVGGRVFVVQGYEQYALVYILEHKLAKASEIKTGTDVPRIRYPFESKTRLHHPDFWLPKQNRLVEVKSVWTAGLTDGAFNLFKQLVAKRNAAIAQGFKYTLLLFDKNKRITLPKDWYTWKKKDLQRYLAEKR